MLSMISKLNATHHVNARRIWLRRRWLRWRQQLKVQKQRKNQKQGKPQKQTKPIAFSVEKYENIISFYLGKDFKQEPPLNIREYNNSQTFADLVGCKNKDSVWHVYVGAFLNVLKEMNKRSQAFKLIVGDNALPHPVGTLLKTRINEDNGSIILRCLEFNRHWKNYYERPADIPFDKKRNILIWRGTTTGTELGANRFNLVKTWFNKQPKIDVGFSFICQGRNAYNKYVKGTKHISDLLKYKYILSIEGNDKDSGINWKLNSNSLVFMAKPTLSSWLMESTLIPNYHYILLKDDFSDLLEKIRWCDNNPNKCKEIIKNANRFMNQFKNQTVEAKIEKAVLRKYFELTGQ